MVGTGPARPLQPLRAGRDCSGIDILLTSLGAIDSRTSVADLAHDRGEDIADAAQSARAEPESPTTRSSSSPEPTGWTDRPRRSSARCSGARSPGARTSPSPRPPFPTTDPSRSSPPSNSGSSPATSSSSRPRTSARAGSPPRRRTSPRPPRADVRSRSRASSRR
ncbi:hypothetical protein IOD13_15140 [Brevibacterium casei]|nr:hypothetical protein [Brevibacterium casei]